ncbi:hypothetical protein AAU61_01815 [Desulfocarbo indianensis]|nr:hypothetical protein AAU61_01815 [Desulfocarbo indianensis]
MRSLVFDELRRDDLEKVRAHLQDILPQSSLPDVFWLELPPDLLSPLQIEHSQSCGPHRVAVVIEEESVRLEFLVRAQESLRCACTEYASKAQREFCLGFMDRLLEATGIRT